MINLFPVFRHVLFGLDPETAHGLTLRLLRCGAAPLLAGTPVQSDRLQMRLAGLTLENPLGLAAGFDKNAQVPRQMAQLGFGFVEVGTVTPRPQPGNPRPRIFRLTEDQAVINRLGFNNVGSIIVSARLGRRRANNWPGVLGVNLGANKDSPDAVADYVDGVRRFAGRADYFTINISSPNTPGLRDLQQPDNLRQLITRVLDGRTGLGLKQHTPLFLKLAPDLDSQELAGIAAVVLEGGIDGVILTNTTIARPDSLQSPGKAEQGGLSGAPLMRASTIQLARMHKLLDGKLPLIGVGGVASGADAYAKIRAGATAVQLYTALIYQGPGLVRRILAELDALLERDGIASVVDAVGLDRDHWADQEI